jgi:hypothetical protein
VHTGIQDVDAHAAGVENRAPTVDSRAPAHATAADDRSTGILGIVFVALSLLWAALVISADAPPWDSPDREVTTFFADGGNRAQLLLAAVALALAGVILVGFAAGFRRVLVRGELPHRWLADAAFGGGVAMAALMFVKNAILGGLPMAAEFSEDFVVDPGAYHALDAVQTGVLIQEGFAAAVLIGGASLYALRTRALPRWLAASGALVAALALLSWFLYGVPLILVLAWLLAASVLLLRRPVEAQPAPAAASRD